MRADAAEPSNDRPGPPWARLTAMVAAGIAGVTMWLTAGLDREPAVPAQARPDSPVAAGDGSAPTDGRTRPRQDAGKAQPGRQELVHLAQRIAAFALANSPDGDTTRVARLLAAVIWAGGTTAGPPNAADDAVHVAGLVDADRDGDDDDGAITIRRRTDQVCLHLMPPFAHYTLSDTNCR